MTKKKSTSDQIVDQITFSRLEEIWLDLIADTQREVAELLADFDVMWSGNAFALLRQGLVDKNPQIVEDVLDDKILEFDERMLKVRGKLLDLRAIFRSVPGVYGGDAE